MDAIQKSIVQLREEVRTRLKGIFKAAIEYGLITFEGDPALSTAFAFMEGVNGPLHIIGTDLPDKEVTGHNAPEYLAQYWADAWAEWYDANDHRSLEDCLYEAAMELNARMEKKNQWLHAYLDTQLEVTQEERSAMRYCSGAVRSTSSPRRRSPSSSCPTGALWTATSGTMGRQYTSTGPTGTTRWCTSPSPSPTTLRGSGSTGATKTKGGQHEEHHNGPQSLPGQRRFPGRPG